MVVWGLVGALYQVLFATAKGRSMPKKVLDYGDMERINISLFVKHSAQESGKLRPYLLDASNLMGISLQDFKIIVAAKRIRYESFNIGNLTNEALLEILLSSIIRDPLFDGARTLLLTHSTLLPTGEEEYESEE